MPVNVIGMQQ